MTPMIKALDALEDIKLYTFALDELSQQLFELDRNRTDYRRKRQAIECAREATREKLTTLFKGFENYLRYDVKIEDLAGHGAK